MTPAIQSTQEVNTVPEVISVWLMKRNVSITISTDVPF